MLMATMWYSDQSPDVFVLDYNMSGEDCVSAIEEMQMLYRDNVVLSCQMERKDK